MQIGIIGLPNVGKSTLFNALTCLSAQAGDFPFTTIEPNIGIVNVPDKRLEKLGEIFKPDKLTSATIKFVDIAGLVKGASRGEGLGNKFLSHIREMDALVHVLRGFSSEQVPNVLNAENPELEKEIIETELIFADLEQVDKIKEKHLNASKSGDKQAKEKYSVFNEMSIKLNQGIPVIKQDIPKDVQTHSFLTSKPVLYVLNIEEDKYKESDKSANNIVICAKLESELVCLSKEEQNNFRKEMDITKTGLDRLIEGGKKLLNLITFYTVVGTEVRAWHIKKGSTVLNGAGKIHTDMEKGFIRADVYNFKDLEELGSEKSVKDKGLVRSEGRDYILCDGDIIKIHFK
ncbi:MAG: redox-regulated ATPase YchF [Endomicrobiales bacterium]|nr:redox-regulated ATPase YchF [Endomicrobiales bacterium]